MDERTYLSAAESVTEGHPDKICDQISDAILDEIIKEDPVARVACETFVTTGLVVVGGEITTGTYVNIVEIARKVLKEIGYTNHAFGFHYAFCAVINAIHEQSPDIAQGVDTGGAGDQGVMIGYATDETPEFIPLAISLAHKVTRKLAEVRKKGEIKYLGPDGKSQVCVQFEKGKPKRIHNVILAAQHTEEILDSGGKRITKKAREELIEKVVKPVLPSNLLDNDTEYYVNETGKFVVGGPVSDTGMTGRKVIMDAYGPEISHGGGAFSGKDPTKVDRSAAYAARYMAKNIVAAGLASKCLIQLSYVIGKSAPLSVSVNTLGTGKVQEEKLLEIVDKNFNLTPSGIIDMLNLRRPIYRRTAAYGHFGRNEEGFTWEQTDRVDDLKKAAGV